MLQLNPIGAGDVVAAFRSAGPNAAAAATDAATTIRVAAPASTPTAAVHDDGRPPRAAVLGRPGSGHGHDDADQDSLTTTANRLLRGATDASRESAGQQLQFTAPQVEPEQPPARPQLPHGHLPAEHARAQVHGHRREPHGLLRAPQHERVQFERSGRLGPATTEAHRIPAPDPATADAAHHHEQHEHDAAESDGEAEGENGDVRGRVQVSPRGADDATEGSDGGRRLHVTCCGRMRRGHARG